MYMYLTGIMTNNSSVLHARRLHHIEILILYSVSMLIFISISIITPNLQSLIGTIDSEKNRLKSEGLGVIQRITGDIFLVNSKGQDRFFITDVLKLIILPIVLFDMFLVGIYFCTEVFVHFAFLLPICSFFFEVFAYTVEYTLNSCLALSLKASIAFLLYYFIKTRLSFISKPLKLTLQVIISCFV
ncbi:hypothetical protein CDIK_4323 [Cucumispora dikerogammari]|nr:hypothetical protein CDIK_4323 [Cucumispora dikerogammari]